MKARLAVLVLLTGLINKAEHPALRNYELATMCYIKIGRRPSLKTIKRVLKNHPLPPLTTRRFLPYHQITDPFERRRAIVRLALEGWTKKSIAAYLQTSRQTVHDTLKRWFQEGLAGLKPRSRSPHRRHRKVTLAIMQRIRRLQRNPLLGAWRMHAALKREGIELSPRTCGRIRPKAKYFASERTSIKIINFCLHSLDENPHYHQICSAVSHQNAMKFGPWRQKNAELSSNVRIFNAGAPGCWNLGFTPTSGSFPI